MNDAHINPAEEGKEKKALKSVFTPTGNDSFEMQALCKQQDTADDNSHCKDGDDKDHIGNNSDLLPEEFKVQIHNCKTWPISKIH